MRTRTAVSTLLAFGIATAISAEVVIPPHIEERGIIAHAVIEETLLDRSDVPELARFVVSPEDGVAEGGLRREGMVQRLMRPLAIALPPELPAATMIGRIDVDGAGAVRLRFDDAPAGTVLWLAGADDATFTRFVPSATAQWGPTTHGSTIFIAAEANGGAMRISEFAHADLRAEASTACLDDVACSTPADFGELADASRAIGYIRFVRKGKTYVCTGGLVNDAANSGTPYFLTASHCISTQEEASSIEVVWDLRSAACGSNRMASVARSHGAELLVSSPATDVALLKLSSLPAGRVFLGVDARKLKEGTVVHRITHAYGLSQTYSAGVVEADGMTCPRAQRPQFVYSRQRDGAIAEGSSGAPLLIEGLHVAGQLLGLCGPDPANACASYNLAVDGSLYESWPLLAPHLAPGTMPKRRAVR